MTNIILSAIIIFLGITAIYYFNKYKEYKKVFELYKQSDDEKKMIVYSNETAEEKIIKLKYDCYENVPF